MDTGVGGIILTGTKSLWGETQTINPPPTLLPPITPRADISRHPTFRFRGEFWFTSLFLLLPLLWRLTDTKPRLAARVERMQTWRRCLELQWRVFRLLGDNRRHLGSKQAKSAGQHAHSAQQLLVCAWVGVDVCIYKVWHYSARFIMAVKWKI